MFFFLLIAQQLFSQAYIVPDLQRDDFNSDKTWWIFQNHGGELDPTSMGGYLYAVLSDPEGDGDLLPGTGFDGMHNVGIMTADQRPIYGKDDYMIVTIRVKTLNALPVGSRGWGFWKSEGVPININQAVWFMEQTAHLDSSWAAEETWWKARTHRTVLPSYDFSIDLDDGSPHNIDNTQWHTYKVIRDGRNSYEQYIDGVLIQSKAPADWPDSGILNEDYSFNCWNDNLVYRFTTNPISGNDTIKVTSNNWTGNSEFVVDFIEIKKGDYKADSSYAPVGARLLREVINEIDDGISDGAFKGPYNFTVPAGGAKVVIIASGKAEELDSYDTDDDIKMILDAKDFGFNSARSWNGDVDQSALKTIVIDTTLSAGSHSLSFETEKTPILYDATVVGSNGGYLVLNQTVDASAPAASNNFEWQTFNFNADAGEVVIYVSGSADEEPGWKHQTAFIDSTDDDELRIELDGYDFGWEVDSSSFVGNTLFGDFKTICIRRDVATTGSHTLKLFANESPYVHKVLVFAKNGDSSLPVELSSFSANRVNGSNVISWVVQSELENAGFNILRAVNNEHQSPEMDSFVKVNEDLILGRGNASTKKTYSFTDNFDPKNQKVWYIIQDVSYAGKVENHGPVLLAQDVLPGRFELKQNYPNPFNPSTFIPFVIPENAKVKIDIFDINGRLIKTLVNAEFNTGEHSVVWDGKGNTSNSVSSGIYYYRLQSKSFTTIKKMTLIH
ncbi:MAG: T9SS C-terminal target domain-containing protein [Calditrichaeota bacterium]|nr:MAG: T9SS C-terminal target domain-containing protein [Calditrichota bacterium]MBL1206326.1 T9SS C-terminal target domain-containing protein [Calditrichota bacterium]NOG46152.1 T9SS type A sorting domain-containing protein [Calditrichota bacterium]